MLVVPTGQQTSQSTSSKGFKQLKIVALTRANPFDFSVCLEVIKYTQKRRPLLSVLLCMFLDGQTQSMEEILRDSTHMTVVGGQKRIEHGQSLVDQAWLRDGAGGSSCCRRGDILKLRKVKLKH